MADELPLPEYAAIAYSATKRWVPQLARIGYLAFGIYMLSKVRYRQIMPEPDDEENAQPDETKPRSA